MTEWGVVGVIIALVSLGVTVGKPILTLIKSITQLSCQMERLGDDLDKLNSQNTQNHKRIWDRIDEQGDTLRDHERRIGWLEHEQDNQA